VWGYRLSIGYSGETETWGRCPEVSFWLLIFVSETRLPGFISSTTGFSRWPGQEQETPSPVIFSEKATQMSGICFEVKFCFGLCISKLTFRLCFVTILDVCLEFASGGAGTSIPPRKWNYLVLLPESKWRIWLQYCFLSCLYFTHDRCRVRPTIMLTVLHVFWSAVGLGICVVSLHEPTFVLFVVTFLQSAVLPCAYCKLTLSRWVYVCTA